MATYTILRQSILENTATVVIEFPVPPGNNAAGVKWRDILAELRVVNEETGTTINPRKTSDSVYLTSLDVGQVVELRETFEYNADLPNADKAAALDAAVAARETAFTSEFAASYRFYGMQRTT